MNLVIETTHSFSGWVARVSTAPISDSVLGSSQRLAPATPSLSPDSGQRDSPRLTEAGKIL